MSQGYSGGPHSMGGNSNNLYPPNIQNMSLHPPDYDPRRLFPFGLSPIPEVPSELASEVSSIASSPTPSYEDSDTEIESVRSRGSIMYSGSCDSIKSNVTLHGKSSSESSTDSEDDATEEETEDEQEGYAVENIPVDNSTPIVKIIDNTVNITYEKDESLKSTNKIETSNPSNLSVQNTLYNSEVTQVMHQRTYIGSKPKTPVPDQDGKNDRNTPSSERPEIPFDMVSGAATASEIFRHLQATRGKQEVTTELAKILTVLKTTLQTETIDKDSSSSDDETTGLHSTPVATVAMPTGKPPRHPQKSKSKSLAAISPVIQAKIKELEQSKSNNPKEEMNLLSKILVHLLCSCKTVAAAQELKGIIKQFKEVAKVAMEEGDDTLELLRSNSRASSRNSVRRKARSRTASGNSNISGNSETDSMNTLTPGDSKSSGTDDETAQESKLNKIRFTSNLDGKQDVESCVSYTLTLPLNKAEENNETIEQEEAEHYDDEDEEWEWEYEDEHDASTPTKQGSSGSSRNLTPSEGKSDASSGSTRKLLTEMEMGAYNSSSTSHSDHGNSQSTPITEEDDFLDDDDQLSGRKRRNSDKTEVSGHLFCHLEETFKVLSDTYKIITTGNSPECEQAMDGSYPKTPDMATQQNAAVDDGFEGILDGISNQCVQIESEILRSSRQNTATPEGSTSPAPPKYINVSRPNSRTGSRAASRVSRPGSRLKPKTPLPDGGEDEEWGDEDEWEYYYEDEYNEEDQQQPSRPVSRQKLVSRPNSRLSDKPASRPQSRQNEFVDQNKTNEASNAPSRPLSRTQEKVPSRPSSRQMEQEQTKPISRPNSRILRPGSKASSRPNSRNTVKGETNEEEWDEGEWGDEDGWEYYYEEEVDAAGNVTSRPVSRGSSRQGGPSRAQSRQGIPNPRGPSRSASRQEEENVSNPMRAASKQEGQRVPSRQEVQRVPSRQEEPRAPSRQEPIRVPSRQDVPQAASRAASRQENGERVPSRIRVVSRPVSRAKSNLAKNDQEGDEGEWEEGEWEYYYEEDYPEEQPEEPANHNEDTSSAYSAKVTENKNTESNTLQLPVVKNKDSRPNSRNSQTSSRPNSRSGSRPGSRTGSRAASRIKRNQSSLGSVYEEDDQWYYDDDDELARLSPTLTTAPTTRATSPFPNEKGSVEYNPGSGFSGRRISIIDECEETTPRPQTVISKTPTNRDSVTPKIPAQSHSRPLSKQSNAECRTPSYYNSGEVGYLNPMAGVSVALAAEYLGQDAKQLVASLPHDFIEENQVGKDRKKKKHRRKDTDGNDDHDEDEDKKKRKKKKNKDGKFLPKVGVKELANRLEGELFQDSQVGTKMVITRDEARDVIRESKKKPKNLVYLQDSSKASTPSRYSPNKEDKRKTVREMVELMANQIPLSDDPNSQQIDVNNYSSNQQNYNIPSISVSSNAPMPPPVPPLPQNYYSSPTPQYPPMQYQPYPVEVRPQYPQQYQQDNPYQQFPPQPPYQQYQQQYHAYQGYPPPPPQHYQQYPPQQYQQYPQYPPQGYQQYPPQPPPQPIIYASDNPNQMKVVAGGQTTMVNMRPKSSGARQKESNRPNKSPEMQQQQSPDDSEAYGTGSTGSDQTENQVAGIDHDETGEQEGGIPKPHKRHSRLFKLLQDSDYTDSDTDSRSEYSRISMKNVEDNHNKESDMDSVCSGLERKATGIDRKHSFRSHKSSNKESDNESVTSSGVERKISPNSMQKNLTTRRFMQLNLNNDYEQSSSELSTPNSPTAPGPDADKRKRSSSKPPSRVWNYHADDFDSHAGVSDDSSYQSLQSLNSFDSIYDNVAGLEVEEIMKRKVQRDNLYRYQTDSPHNYVTASPKTVEMIRNSPKTHSSSPRLQETYQRASPKFEQELMDLANFPSSPGISLRQLHSHRGFYGGGVGK